MHFVTLLDYARCATPPGVVTARFDMAIAVAGSTNAVTLLKHALDPAENLSPCSARWLQATESIRCLTWGTRAVDRDAGPAAGG